MLLVAGRTARAIITTRHRASPHPAPHQRTFAPTAVPSTRRIGDLDPAALSPQATLTEKLHSYDLSRIAQRSRSYEPCPPTRRNAATTTNITSAAMPPSTSPSSPHSQPGSGVGSEARPFAALANTRRHPTSNIQHPTSTPAASTSPAEAPAQ